MDVSGIDGCSPSNNNNNNNHDNHNNDNNNNNNDNNTRRRRITRVIRNQLTVFQKSIATAQSNEEVNFPTSQYLVPSIST